MKRQLFQATLVLASLLFATALVGCRGGHGLRVAVSATSLRHSAAARVHHVGTLRDKLFPFSISGTRRFQDEVATDPLRQTNPPLEDVLGSSHELAAAIANHGRSDLKLAPFASEPSPVDIGEQQPEAARVEDIVVSEEPTPNAQDESASGGEAQVEADLPSSEAFARDLRSEITQDSDSPSTTPERVDEEERLREARIQQLLDLLAKAEEQAAASLKPSLPEAPLVERAREHELEVVEPQIIPHQVQAPQEIVLRATATIPYQSVRSERVELLNVQQMAPTIPARPGLPAVVQRPPVSGETPRGWANQDWARELVPDFSALGSSAPEEVKFTPLPAVQNPGSDSQTAGVDASVEGQQSVGRIVPEPDTNPATAARPIQKSGERR